MSISWAFNADGAVRLPVSGRLIPFAAHSRSDKSCRSKPVESQSVAEALKDKAFITGNPLAVSGGFNTNDPVLWENSELAGIRSQIRDNVFFIVHYIFVQPEVHPGLSKYYMLIAIC